MFVRIFILAALSLGAPAALASTASGYVTGFQVNNSSSSYACYFRLSSSASSSSGTTYTLDDVSGEFASTCLAVMLAMDSNDYISVYYNTSGSTLLVEGIYSTESGNVPYFWTNDYTGTGSADRCKATMSGSSGSVYAYVDDNNPEEYVTCATLAMLHFLNSATWTVNRSSSYEVTSLVAYY